jgi:hypothetical protein
MYRGQTKQVAENGKESGQEGSKESGEERE